MSEAVAAVPASADICAYIQDMVLELADIASANGETALAASLALVAVQAGSCREVKGPIRSPR